MYMSNITRNQDFIESRARILDLMADRDNFGIPNRDIDCKLYSRTSTRPKAILEFKHPNFYLGSDDWSTDYLFAQQMNSMCWERIPVLIVTSFFYDGYRLLNENEACPNAVLRGIIVIPYNPAAIKIMFGASLFSFEQYRQLCKKLIGEKVELPHQIKNTAAAVEMAECIKKIKKAGNLFNKHLAVLGSGRNEICREPAPSELASELEAPVIETGFIQQRFSTVR